MSYMMNAVYNNYLSAYTPKALTKYDAHKRSELRSVCNSIKKINQDAPWYLPTTNKDTQHYAVDLKENARAMRNTIAQLGGLEEEGSLNKKRAFSSDEDVASAAYSGSPLSGADAQGFDLTVLSLASDQENLGLFLPDEKVSLAAGTYSFDLNINDINYEFQFPVGESETNREVQERLMRLINNSGIGITASLAQSEDKTALKLTSDAAGLPQGKTCIFSVSDNRTSRMTGAVSYFGLDYVSRDAANAQFLVDGKQESSSSNHVTIGKVFDVELKGVSEPDTSTRIGLKTDLESFTDNVSHLIGGYNEFLRAAASYQESQIKSRQLVSELRGIATVYESSLESLGLGVSDDGTLTLDTDFLQQTATQAEDLSEAFDPLKKFSSSLLRKSNQISIDPMDYVQKTIVAYKNPGHTYVSPYNTSAYSGMMFNSYC